MKRILFCGNNVELPLVLNNLKMKRFLIYRFYKLSARKHKQPKLISFDCETRILTKITKLQHTVCFVCLFVCLFVSLTSLSWVLIDFNQIRSEGMLD